jgi:hypothetical protein
MDFAHHLEFDITRKHDVLETGSVSVFKQAVGDTFSGGSLKKR